MEFWYWWYQNTCRWPFFFQWFDRIFDDMLQKIKVVFYSCDWDHVSNLDGWNFSSTNNKTLRYFWTKTWFSYIMCLWLSLWLRRNMFFFCSNASIDFPLIVDWLVFFWFSFLDTIYPLWIDVLRLNKGEICWVTDQWLLSLTNMRCLTIEVSEHHSVLLVQLIRYKLKCCSRVIF